MHGIVHKTLKEYVVAKTDDETWATIVDRADVESTLYLPVSHYDDDDAEAILATVSEMAVQDRRAIERDFGRMLAPNLVRTFDAYIDADGGLEGVLTSLEAIVDDVAAASEETSPPDVSSRPEPAVDAVVVTYRTHRDRDYCALAHGILEGIATTFDTDATVTKTACIDDANDDACRFRVQFE
ncbi:heme NO-binding domain-containing protein [Halosolutus amylolyticus]|uniref:Heme NO-binding domain-containing protein n=1 Tax=Halosolutus amylolyticus TaxID=2932267 RepID=A0ABD5PJR2_9EURY|nr:heme NO-binding domain-containing protein [Halosolutus amylolyticus]